MNHVNRSFRFLAAVLLGAGWCLAGETELKDETGKTILHYIVEAPANVAPAGTTDPAKQVGVIFCFQEHTSPPGADIFPVRESLKRQGLSDGYVLLAIRAQASGGGVGKGDYEPIQKLLDWAKKTYPVNPRRVYMYGKGSGGLCGGRVHHAAPRVDHGRHLVQLGLVDDAIGGGEAA